MKLVCTINRHTNSATQELKHRHTHLYISVSDVLSDDSKSIRTRDITVENKMLLGTGIEPVTYCV
jgi:hypothetical protein